MPAVFLLVCEIPWAIYVFIFSLFKVPQAFDNLTPESVGEITSYLTMNIASIVIISGAVAMLRLNSYGTARLGAIFALLPICSPCIFFGIPLGIWAMVVLLNPEVKAAFKKP
jgi:hypothetical protein